MALAYRSLFNKFNFLSNLTKPVKWSVGEKYPIRTLASVICNPNPYARKPVIDSKVIIFQPASFRLYSTPTSGSGPPNACPPPEDPPPKAKLGIIQKFKVMYRDYWYVLIPVHVATSIVWFGSSYYAVRRYIILN